MFCNANLGRNEALEAFPVGRRLAYDAANGRLWVICTRCGRWNLTPLEERWEAIDDAERLYRGAPRRAFTDNVGLVRVGDGLDLVRVGRPLLPEFAAWRYGKQLRARRVRSTVRAVPVTAVGVVAAGAAIATRFVVPQLLAETGVSGFVAAVGGWYAFGKVGDVLGGFETAVRRAFLGTPATVAARVRVAPDRDAPALVVRRGHLAESSLRTSSDGVMSLDLRHDAGRTALVGRAARHAATILAPTLNPEGASATVLDEVVRAVVARGGPEGYLSVIGRWVGNTTRPMARPPARWTKDTEIPENGLYALTAAQRLALELVLHDDVERRAMRGELAALEQAWRDAEEIAAIADGLALPRGVEAAWERLRAGVRR